jgi:hypothetical protein
LKAPEFEDLKKYLNTMPPSRPRNENNHYIVSFQQKGQWITQFYDTLPVGNPFERLVERMNNQSGEEADPDIYPYDEFLKPAP